MSEKSSEILKILETKKPEEPAQIEDEDLEDDNRSQDRIPILEKKRLGFFEAQEKFSPLVRDVARVCESMDENEVREILETNPPVEQLDYEDSMLFIDAALFKHSEMASEAVRFIFDEVLPTHAEPMRIVDFRNEPNPLNALAEYLREKFPQQNEKLIQASAEVIHYSQLFYPSSLRKRPKIEEGVKGALEARSHPPYMEIMMSPKGELLLEKLFYHYSQNARKGKYPRQMLQRHPEFCVALFGRELGLFPPVLISPVTEYGASFSEKLIQTTQVMTEKMLRSMQAEIQTTYEGSKKFFDTGTVRGRVSTDIYEVSPVLKTLSEGIASIKDAAFFMLAAKLRIDGKEGGYVDDPDQALKLMIDQDVFTRVARIVPMGMIGPLNLTGYSFRGIASVGVKGDVRINCPVRDVIREDKHRQKSGGAYWGYPDGFGCPVAHGQKNDKTSALTELHRAFLDIYKKLPK